MPDSSNKSNPVDPIEYGKILYAVEMMVEQNKVLTEGLKRANEDVRSLTQSRADTDRKLDELITHVKHLNGTDAKLERLGLRLDDHIEHRKDQLWTRQQRRKSEARSGMLYKAKASLIASISLAAVIWIATTLWNARDTIGTAGGG